MACDSAVVQVCTPGEQQPCSCEGDAGFQTCAPDGASFGACECAAGGAGTGANGGGPPAGGAGAGGGLPSCEPGATEACYDGPPQTAGVGSCTPGARTCEPNGQFGPCEGQVLPALDDCQTAADEDCDGAPAPCPSEFAQLFDFDGQAELLFAAADPSGNIYVSGTFSESVGVGADTLGAVGFIDIFVAKLDPTGEPLWARSFGFDQGYFTLGGMTVLPGGQVLLSGIFSGTIDLDSFQLVATDPTAGFVLSLSPTGEGLWGRATTGNVNVPLGVAKGPGSLVATGFVGSLLSFGGPETLDTGTLLQVFDGVTGSVQAERTVSALGQGFLVGDDSGWTAGTRNPNMTVDLGGAPIMVGQGIVVAQYDTTLSHQQSFGFIGGTEAPLAAARSANNLLFGGNLAGNINFGGITLDSMASSLQAFVASITSSGTLGDGAVWKGNNPSTTAISVRAISTTSDGVVVGTHLLSALSLAGQDLAPIGPRDALIVRTDDDLAIQNLRTFGAANSTMNLQVVGACGDGLVLVAGSFAKSGAGDGPDFGLGPTSVTNGDYGYVACVSL